MRYANHLLASLNPLYIASTNEVIDYVHVQSKDTSNRTANIVLQTNGKQFFLIEGVLLPNGSARYPGPINMQAGDAIYGSTDVDNLVECFIP